MLPLTLAPAVYCSTVASEILRECKSHHVTPLFEILQCLPTPLALRGKLPTVTFRTVSRLTIHCLSDVTHYHSLAHSALSEVGSLMFINMPGTLPPQDLCTCCCLCLACLPRHLPSFFLHFSQFSGRTPLRVSLETLHKITLPPQYSTCFHSSVLFSVKNLVPSYTLCISILGLTLQL